ncbi:unnamed protein product, partial [Meganyctiphanes norvegica]
MSVPSFSRSISSSGVRTKYTNDSHGILLSGMAKLQKDKMFTDVILCCGELELHAHKVVLAGALEYFRSMFTMGMQESSQSRISLNNLDATSLEDIVNFLYTGQIYIDTEKVQKLIETANFLNVKFIVESGGDFLARGLDSTNCLGILQFADAYGIIELKDKAKDFALKNMHEILSEEEFLQTLPEIIVEFLSSEYMYLHANNVIFSYKEAETLLFKACLKYVHYNEAERTCHLKTLLSHIRFHQLESDFLTNVLQDPLIKEDRDLICRLEDAQHNNEGCEIKPRIPANIHIGKSYDGMAMTRRGAHPRSHFIAKPNEGSCVTTYVSGIKLWIRLWDGRQIVGGLGLFFSDGNKKMYGNQETQETYEFNINPEERIVKIEASSGWMVDCLSFITNTGNKYGPYGGDGGDKKVFSAPNSFGFLTGFVGTVVHTQESEAITFLQPIWTYVKEITTDQSSNYEDEDEDDYYGRGDGIVPLAELDLGNYDVANEESDLSSEYEDD